MIPAPECAANNTRYNLAASPIVLTQTQSTDFELLSSRYLILCISSIASFDRLSVQKYNAASGEPRDQQHAMKYRECQLNPGRREEYPPGLKPNAVRTVWLECILYGGMRAAAAEGSIVQSCGTAKA